MKILRRSLISVLRWQTSFQRAATLSFVLICFATSVHAQKRGLDLGMKVDVEFSEDAMITVLYDLSADWRIPVGLVRLGPEEPSRVTLRAKGITLGSLIEVLREEFPEYAFEIADDVLNVFPADIKDESLARLLDLRIDHFDLGRFGNRNTLRDSIYELPEVEAFRLENKLEAVKAYNATNANFVLDDRAPKRLSGLTIKNLLNTIVRYSSSKFWLVKRYGEKGDKLLLSF